MFYNYEISRLRIHKGSMYGGAPSSLLTRDTEIFYNGPWPVFSQPLLEEIF